MTTADACGRSNVVRCAPRANPVSRYTGPRFAATGRPRPGRRVRVPRKRDSDRTGQALPLGRQTANPVPRRTPACKVLAEQFLEAAAEIRSQHAAALLAPATEVPHGIRRTTTRSPEKSGQKPCCKQR